MTIFLLANTSWYLYNFRKNLIIALLEKKFQVVVCAPYDKYSIELENLGVHYHNIKLSRCGINILKETVSLLKIRNILFKTKPDILFTFTPKGNIYPALIKPAFIKQISNITGLGEGLEKNNVLAIVLKALFKMGLSRSDKVFFQNQEDMDSFIRNKIVNPEIAVRINGSGTDLKRFKPLQLGKFSNEKICFLTLGRVIPQKGYDLIISLIKKYPLILEKAEFHILGIPDKSRKCSANLFEKLKELAEKNIISLHEPVDNVEKFINRAHCILLPSTYNEGIPRSLIEGLACGLPILTTDWKGCRDTVLEGKNGYLIKPGSVEDLHDKILRITNLSLEERKLFSKESRRLAITKFNEDVIIGMYIDFCKKIQFQKGFVNNNLLDIPLQ